MTEDQTLTEVTTRVLTGMERVLLDARPEIVLVHGDTTTSTAAALAAFYQQDCRSATLRLGLGRRTAGCRTPKR